MAKIEEKLQQMGLVLPEPLKVPAGIEVPFSMVIVSGNRAYISGHAPQNPDGSIAEPFGKVGGEVSVERASELAQLVALSMLGSLKRELGDLDRIKQWLRVLGMVNVAPGFTMTTPVINGFSKFILTLFGPKCGAHTRSAVGMAVLPLDIAVEIEAEVEIMP